MAAGIGPGSVVFMRWYPDEEILVLSLRNTADTGTWAAWSVSSVLANIAQSYTTTPGGGQRIYEGTVEEIESLLSGTLLERYRALPVDYQKALAAYLELGVSAEYMPALVEHQLAQWPAEPEPLIDLLGAEGYERFEGLDRRDTSFRYHAFFLLTVYTWANATEKTFEGRRQAVVNLLRLHGPLPGPGERRRVRD